MAQEDFTIQFKSLTMSKNVAKQLPRIGYPKQDDQPIGWMSGDQLSKDHPYRVVVFRTPEEELCLCSFDRLSAKLEGTKMLWNGYFISHIILI